ncbi:molybdenum cofactor guanylyltransferase [Leptospira perdikensis]|uniref:Molybdenum cofactor guanylyltransferase n=1 Tax=Leptospira perdikensis TaxID=2484948 RepID=A0A4V3JP85_9LEPT|nr:molybdenum cofactor guanylyltransferase [Leptospira perdikensis]TGL40346.1 molybdenum cofactor guanylyltransferase [Leptospira perdikensis]
MTHTNTDPTFVLLVGGRSVRMGEDKGFVTIGSNSHFLDQILKKLNGFTSSIYISLRAEQVESYVNYLPKSSLILDQNLPVEGPLKGILSSYLYLKKNNEWNDFMYVMPIDIPFVEDRTIKRLLDTFHGQQKPVSGIFYESKTGLEPLCGIYTTSTLSSWEKSLFVAGNQEFSLQKRIKSLDLQPILVKLPSEEEINFRNINSKNEL